VVISDYTRTSDGRVRITYYNTTNDVKHSDDLNTDEQVKSYEFIRGVVIGKNTNLVIDNILESDIPAFFKEICHKLGVKSSMAVAIKHEYKAWDGIYIAEYNEYRHWTDEEITLLETIASQISIAIRQAELFTQAQQASKAKSEFLASMSHELRTPLNSIIGFTDMIRGGNYGKLPDKVTQYLCNVSKSSKHLLNLINDVLDISKVEADKIELKYENIRSKLLIMDLVTGIQPLADKNNIKIDLQLQDIMIKADSKRLIQIINNLLSNAVKFTPEGGKVTVKTVLSNNNLVTTIEDTGIGIDKKHYDKIQRGLGLSDEELRDIINQIIKYHSVLLYSSP